MQLISFKVRKGIFYQSSIFPSIDIKERYYSYPDKTVHSKEAKIYYSYTSTHPPSIIEHNIWDLLRPQPLGSDHQLLNKRDHCLRFGWREAQ